MRAISADQGFLHRRCRLALLLELSSPPGAHALLILMAVRLTVPKWTSSRA